MYKWAEEERRRGGEEERRRGGEEERIYLDFWEAQLFISPFELL